jgi:hypothetical protein
MTNDIWQRKYVSIRKRNLILFLVQVKYNTVKLSKPNTADNWTVVVMIEQTN